MSTERSGRQRQADDSKDTQGGREAGHRVLFGGRVSCSPEQEEQEQVCEEERMKEKRAETVKVLKVHFLTVSCSTASLLLFLRSQKSNPIHDP